MRKYIRLQGKEFQRFRESHRLHMIRMIEHNGNYRAEMWCETRNDYLYYNGESNYIGRSKAYISHWLNDREKETYRRNLEEGKTKFSTVG